MSARDELINRKVELLQKIQTRNILLRAIREEVIRFNSRDHRMVEKLDNTIKALP